MLTFEGDHEYVVVNCVYLVFNAYHKIIILQNTYLHLKTYMTKMLSNMYSKRAVMPHLQHIYALNMV